MADNTRQPIEMLTRVAATQRAGVMRDTCNAIAGSFLAEERS